MVRLAPFCVFLPVRKIVTMSELLQEAMIEIPSVDFDGKSEIEASTACDLWEKWAVANASSFSPGEWTAMVHVLCALRQRYIARFVYTN